MKLLLDTHVFLWIASGGSDLSNQTLKLLRDGTNTVYFSAASAWEIAIKRSLGKLQAPEDLLEEVARLRFTPLPVSLEHALAVERLPYLHKDPFDRLLIAQAISDNLNLVTRDETIREYDLSVISA